MICKAKGTVQTENESDIHLLTDTITAQCQTDWIVLNNHEQSLNRINDAHHG